MELPWVPRSPPALGRDLSLALLSGKAGRTRQHTGLGAWGPVRKQDSTAGGHSHRLDPAMHPLSSGIPGHTLRTAPASSPGHGQGRRGLTGQLPHSACLASPHPLPFELEPPPPCLCILTQLHTHPSTAGWRRATWAGPGRAGVDRGMHSILRSPSQTHGGWGGGQSLGSPCPPRVMNELTICY